MNGFIPEQPKKSQTVPFYEDANRDSGWQGYSTTKSIERLKSEVTESITRLGGFVSGFQQGVFMIENQERPGFQIYYSLSDSNNKLIPGRLDIAALPVINTWDTIKKEKSLRMALYMLRTALDGMWFFQQLSPGYAPLMPFMIVDSEGKTVSQLWAESSTMSNLLPPGNADFVEGKLI